jgi:hypothetical protein
MLGLSGTEPICPQPRPQLMTLRSRFLILQAGLAKMNIRKPSDVQTAAIPTILAKKNTAIQSYTGSGKVRTSPCPQSTPHATVLALLPPYLHPPAP